MKKTKRDSAPMKNVTLEKLAGLPFHTVKAWKEAQDAVHMQVWRRLEEAKVIHEMLKRPEYKFWQDEFRQGLVCGFGEKGDLNLGRRRTFLRRVRPEASRPASHRLQSLHVL